MPDGLISAEQRSSISINKAVGNGLLLVSIIVCLGSIVLTGGIYTYHNFVLKKETAALKDEVVKRVNDLRDPTGPNNTNLDQILELDRRLASLRQLLENHVISSNAFLTLEENTLSRVRYAALAFSTDARKMDLSGETVSYAALAEQVRTFESLSEVERVDFTGLSLSDKGTLDFKLGLTFKPTLVRWRDKK